MGQVDKLFSQVLILHIAGAHLCYYKAWLAWAYLVVFGSVFAFTSFVKALRLLPTTVVMTYAYVNPVIAVFLGWWLLREPVTIWTFAGSILIVLGVAGVFHEKARSTVKRT